MQGKITKTSVDKLEPWTLLWDSEVKGFGVRRHGADARHYLLRYRFGGRQTFRKIGRHGSPFTPDTARNEAHERTKNKLRHELPLAPQALAILKERRTKVGGDHVFKEFNWYRGKLALDAALKGIAPWRLHDLRRTAATGMAELGVQPHIIEAVLNHVSGHKSGVAGVYNRAKYADEMRSALQRWADHVEALIVGPRKQPVPTGLMERAFAVARGSKIVPEEDLANLARQLTPLKRA